MSEFIDSVAFALTPIKVVLSIAFIYLGSYRLAEWLLSKRDD